MNIGFVKEPLGNPLMPRRPKGEKRAVPTSARPSSSFRTKRAGSLPQFAKIFFHKNVTNVFTADPAERLHDPLRQSLDMGVRDQHAPRHGPGEAPLVQLNRGHFAGGIRGAGWGDGHLLMWV